MTMSLDVIYHLVEDAVFDEYMTTLFSHATQLVLVYSSNHDEPVQSPHVRHREYASWIDDNKPDWKLLRAMKQPFPRT